MSYLSFAPITFAWLLCLPLIAAYFIVKDNLRKSTVIFYELSPEVALAYERLHQWFEEMCRRSKIWHIKARGDVFDTKYHAGANYIIKRNRITPGKNSIKELKTNMDFPVIDVGRQKLVLMPERLLIFDADGVGAVSYQNLHMETYPTHFIEDGFVPKDTRIVDHTWKYVNRNGGHERRFKDNHQIPIAEYEAIHFRSKSGLNELIYLSRPGVGEALAKCFLALGSMTSKKEI